MLFISSFGVIAPDNTANKLNDIPSISHGRHVVSSITPAQIVPITPPKRASGAPIAKMHGNSISMTMG